MEKALSKIIVAKRGKLVPGRDFVVQNGQAWLVEHERAISAVESEYRLVREEAGPVGVSEEREPSVVDALNAAVSVVKATADELREVANGLGGVKQKLDWIEVEVKMIERRLSQNWWQRLFRG